MLMRKNSNLKDSKWSIFYQKLLWSHNCQSFASLGVSFNDVFRSEVTAAAKNKREEVKDQTFATITTFGHQTLKKTQSRTFYAPLKNVKEWRLVVVSVVVVLVVASVETSVLAFL